MSCLPDGRGYRCPICKDRLIHQERRGPHEAASGLLQWIHDNVGRRMNVVDDDSQPGRFHVVRQRVSPPLVREFEHKPSGFVLKDSQRFLLPIRALGLRSAVNVGQIHPDSGVFVVWSDPPHDSGVVAQVSPVLPLMLSPRMRLTGSEWRDFWAVRWIPDGQAA